MNDITENRYVAIPDDNSQDAPPITIYRSLEDIFNDEQAWPFFIKACSQGFSSAFIAIHIIGNSLLMSQYNAEDASNIVSTFQSLIVAFSNGFVSNVGTFLDKVEGQEQKTEDIIKISWINSLGAGVISSFMFFAAIFSIPAFLSNEKSITNPVKDFFWGFLLAPPAYVLIYTHGLIMLKISEDHLTQLVSAIMYRLPSLGLGYLFSIIRNMQILGIGLGSTVAAWLCLFWQCWYLKNFLLLYHPNTLCNIPFFYDFYWKIFRDGCNLAFQRVSEWLNLFIITMLISKYDGENAASAIVPSIQIMIFSNLIMQGFAQATMLKISSVSKAIVRMESNEHRADEEYLILQKRIYNLFMLGNILGIAFSSLIAISLICTRKYIINLYMDANNPGKNKSDLATTLLIINVISLVPDSIRQISAAALRGKDKIFYPTLVNLIIMTVCGTSLGCVIGDYQYNQRYATSLFAVRAVTIAISAIINAYWFLEKPASFCHYLGSFYPPYDDHQPNQQITLLTSEEKGNVI